MMQDPEDPGHGPDEPADTGHDLADQAVSAGDSAVEEAHEEAGDAMVEAHEAVDSAVDTATEGVDTKDVDAAAVTVAAGADASDAEAAAIAVAAGAAMTPAPAQPPTAPPPPAEPASPHAARPTGITILAALAILNGLWFLFLALPAAGISLFTETPASGMATGFSYGVVGLFWLAVGIGAFMLKRWVWMLGLIAAGLSLLSVLLSIVTGDPTLCCGVFGLIVPGILLWYLTRPHVKAAFGR